MSNLPLREELNINETWDLSHLFKTQEDFIKEYNKLLIEVDTFNKKFENQLHIEEKFLTCLETLEDLTIRIAFIHGYAGLNYEVDKLKQINEDNVSKLEYFSEYVNKKLSFIKTELVSLDEKYLATFKEKHTKFAAYIQDIERNKTILLSKKEEELLASLETSIYNQYSSYMSTKFQDLNFEDFVANGKTYKNSYVNFEGQYECHPNYEVRHESFKSFHNTLDKYKYTAANNYINYVQTDKKMATLRGFDSVIDYLLFSQDVKREAYDRQIDTLMKDFSKVMRRYANLLKKEKELDEISLADIKMPFTNIEMSNISISDAKKMLLDTFEVFGEEYQEIIRKSFDERWIDFPMNKTKSTGGFCSTFYNGPAYILLNWTGLLSEALVLAHEIGHAAHYQLSFSKQSPLSPDVSLYFVEAPSTANEVIMCNHLLNQDLSKEDKRNLIAAFISRTYFHNMVTHLIEAEFQRKVYRALDNNINLNLNLLNQYFTDTLKEFWQDSLIINPLAELTWMRQPHYFMGLYPYTYSCGLTIGTNVANKIKDKDTDTIKNWLDTLKAGGTLGPLELSKKAGVSMEDTKALETTIAYVDSLLDKLEELK